MPATEAEGDEVSANREARQFAAIEVQCRAARATGVAVEEGSYRLCGETARIRVAGARLATALLPSLDHLRDVVAAGEPTLGIDLWDAGESGVDGLPEPQCLAAGRRWDLVNGHFAISADARFVSLALPPSVVWLDRRRGRISGWFEDASAATLHQRGKPLQMLLAVRASDRGMAAVHAACVAHPSGSGVLLPASSGAGKSTVALACLRAGYACLGDDWVGLSRAGAGAWVGHGLYSSLFLEVEQARRFGALADRLLPPIAAGDGKSMLLAHRLFPGRFAASAPIRAVAIPRFRPGRATALRPASRSEVLLSLVPSSVFSMRPRLDAGGFERLAELAGEVPGYVLETGDDFDAIPRCLSELGGG